MTEEVKKHVICQFSGGYDSTAAAILALEKYHSAEGVFFDYGQPYQEQELQAANRISTALKKLYPKKWLGFRVINADIYYILPAPGNLPNAYTPLRNLVFAAMSANYAQARQLDTVVVGNKTLELRPDDPYCFKDCSGEFFDLTEGIINYATEDELPKVKFEMILHKEHRANPRSKAEVLQIISDKGIPLTVPWTCYETGVKPCGSCYHCQELKKAKKELKKMKEEAKNV